MRIVGSKNSSCDFGNETKGWLVSVHGEVGSELGRQLHGAKPMKLLSHRQYDWIAKAEEGEKAGRWDGWMVGVGSRTEQTHVRN